MAELDLEFARLLDVEKTPPGKLAEYGAAVVMARLWPGDVADLLRIWIEEE